MFFAELGLVPRGLPQFFVNQEGRKFPIPEQLKTTALNLRLNLVDHLTSYLGKLGRKQEAAGKVRVFAMVDCWTQ